MSSSRSVTPVVQISIELKGAEGSLAPSRRTRAPQKTSSETFRGSSKNCIQAELSFILPTPRFLKWNTYIDNVRSFAVRHSVLQTCISTHPRNFSYILAAIVTSSPHRWVDVCGIWMDFCGRFMKNEMSKWKTTVPQTIWICAASEDNDQHKRLQQSPLESGGLQLKTPDVLCVCAPLCVLAPTVKLLAWFLFLFPHESFLTVWTRCSNVLFVVTLLLTTLTCTYMHARACDLECLCYPPESRASPKAAV